MKSALTVSVLLLLTAVFAGSGCVPEIQPEYQGKVELGPDELIPFIDKENGIEMGVPAGWEKQALPPAADEDLRHIFVKVYKEAKMEIYCQGAFVNRTGLAILPLRVVSGMDPEAVEIWEPRSLGGGLFDPEFTAYSGKTMSGYDLVETNYYLAWKHQAGFNCKYGIVMHGPKQHAAELEKDFLGIVSSLK